MEASASAVMEIVDDSREFFAPVSSDLIDGLLAQYQSMRGRIDRIANLIDGEMAAAVSYFIDGNQDNNRYTPSVERLFQKDGAVAALNSAYWSKTMSLTDVLDCMPQKRRDEWNKSITERTAPEFTEEAVRPTISGLLAQRQKFFAERVDGIFRALSHEHVTNVPEGFSKRMILSGVTDKYTFTNHSQAGVINDLRAIIARFMGRDEPKWNMTGPVIAAARRNHGEWMILDGGALRMRVYMKGTAHLEIHPEIAYRLNQVLANLYPAAIPSQFRTKPAKKHKEFQMMGRPLPFLVVDILSQLRRERGSNRFTFSYGSSGGKVATQEAIRVLESIGGTVNSAGIEFDYDPQAALDEIVASGCVPDQKAHQYYPTPRNVAEAAIEMAQIGEDDECLEPSAGQGGLADMMPKERTLCIEISKLHCDILLAKGHNVEQADFLSANNGRKFDRIVMNPPYSEGRWQAHISHAATMLKQDGQIVAILPASAKGKDVLPGFSLEWSDVFSNEFAGTSVSVVILAAAKVAA